ncbi:dihydropteroate synthase [Acinetobacter sp. ANC 4633]|uniref:dihydropteroate synthase n=1 Tax=Acinetobacter sp. ANC 4633 TaxID=2529845 RepID=UPI00103EC7E8|nr:dihydropteroate synthase [Acinetobacter sp. ANC 4633]TCB28015.1 dihydropteroate synthase [Acinetobacter sp. ANC 4633]
MQYVPLSQRQLGCGRKLLDLSQPHVMGILNVTPDSFSDGGLHNSKQQAIEHALQMIADGATVIDIGGESTRPGAAVVTVEEELTRVIPVVEVLAKEDVILSIDTSQPEVMRQAVQAGAHIWNDVRALTRPNALETAAELNIPVILMHMRGEPTTMNQLADYQDVTAEVIAELKQKIDLAIQVGVAPENIMIDPGFGFAKNTAHNLQLLNELWQLHELGYPILSALSRKRFIGAVVEEADAKARAVGSVAGHLLSIQQGACMVRAHDVKATVDAIKVWQAMQNWQEWV